MLPALLSPFAFPWVKALLAVAVLSVAFIWWRGRGGTGKAAAEVGGKTSSAAASLRAAPANPALAPAPFPPAALLGSLAEQLRRAAEDVELARREKGRAGQRMHLYGARQRLEAIAAAAGGDAGTLSRISVQANLSWEKLSDYVERGLAMIGEGK
jgi:hypothetical protein